MKFFNDDDLFSSADFRPKTDCCVAAAGIIGGASLLGAGASAFGNITAANDQTKAQEAAIQAQQQMFNVGQANLAPFIQAGQGGISLLQNYLNNPNSTLAQAQGLNNTNNPNSALSQLLALTTPGSNQTKALESTPGFQFLSQYGTMATENAQAAQGAGGPGGNLAAAISQYNQGLAGTQYGTIVGALQNALNSGTSNLLNTYGAGAAPLQNLVNTGANAAGGLANNAVQTGQGIASSTAGIGNAQAAAANSIGNTVGNTVSGLGSTISNQQLLSLLSGQGGLFGSSPAGATSLYGSATSGLPPSNAAISGATDQQAALYEQMFGQ